MKFNLELRLKELQETSPCEEKGASDRYDIPDPISFADFLTSDSV